MTVAERTNPTAQDTFEHLLEMRLKNGIPTDAERLRSVFLFAMQQYGARMHWTGERLMDHCLEILRIFLRFDPDDDMVAVCILHHILDSKEWTLDDLEQRFGHDVRHAISNEFLLSHVTLKNRRMSLESLRLMFLKVSQDLQLVLLILSQQYHMLQLMDTLESEDRKRICRDTLHIYAPVAARLGIYWLKNQMEAKAFPVLHSVDAVRIAEQLEQLHQTYGSFLPVVSNALKHALKEAGLEAGVEMREKQPYSIFHKMKVKSVMHVEDVYDLFALRVIVSDEAACYQALGVLHRIGHPVAGRFKDYIAFPKPNGYKSLHTTLAQLPGVPSGMFIEVQIRTPLMQHEAEYGVTAHWSYKEGGNHSHALRHTQVQQALLEPRRSKPDQIFVLTPQGDIIELPEGATPLDFAFHVHTTLGLSFKAAKVNGSIVQLSHTLENGDIVEILKYPNPQPSHRWMSLLKTASARARLKKYLSTQQRPEYIAHGRELLTDHLRKRHVPILDTDLSLLRLYHGEVLTHVEREDLLAKIGSGALQISTLLPQLDLLKEYFPKEEEETRDSSKNALQVARVEGNILMPVLYAKCCKPDQHRGEALSGVISRTGDVRVHCSTCKLLKNVNPGRRIAVKWMTISR
jgi:guanosine-3',5'-bis(diphosphate) 3'-pyrophosphohydrolase